MQAREREQHEAGKREERLRQALEEAWENARFSDREMREGKDALQHALTRVQTLERDKEEMDRLAQAASGEHEHELLRCKGALQQALAQLAILAQGRGGEEEEQANEDAGGRAKYAQFVCGSAGRRYRAGLVTECFEWCIVVS